jgi:hypothetical protein
MAVIGSVSVGASSQATVLSRPVVGGYQFIAIGNVGESTAYLKFFPDGDDVTTTNGIPLAPGASILLDQDDSPIMNNGIYAICASGASTVLGVQAY